MFGCRQHTRYPPNYSINLVGTYLLYLHTMESWKIITYNVAVYMFFFEIRPLDTYLTAYLTGPDGNVSLSEIYEI
ncbi:folate transporter 1-like isoform X2 [Aphis craccivora]|uniref:Folate transporter 1-like isoform X2 n=1 Tax=Aphis craccivora TaxID=307492 RepID=A0A6G0YDI7_APHCR|nr:folate transporter 1-like isoform X2 [Aphis craccivora]